MLRRLPRPAAVLVAALLLPSLAACGSSDGPDKAKPSSTPSSATSASASAGAADLSGVSFDGDVGKGLTSTWKAAIPAPSATTVTTLVKGTGATVAEGDTVSAYLYLGDGTTQKDAYSDYTNGSPQSIPFDAKLSEVFSTLLTNATYGSRVAAVTSATDLFGATGNTQLGVGPKDTLVVVADVVEKAAVAPTPTDATAHDAAPGDQPQVVAKGGSPTGLDWSGVKEPALDTPVQRVVLKKGTGAAVKASDTVTVNYLGETFKATTPFDESYTTKPLTSPLSGLIQGWSIGLTGVPVGSRVLLQIPPGYGYGADGSGSSIPPNATLWFVIDIVSVG